MDGLLGLIGARFMHCSRSEIRAWQDQVIIGRGRTGRRHAEEDKIPRNTNNRRIAMPRSVWMGTILCAIVVAASILSRHIDRVGHQTPANSRIASSRTWAPRATCSFVEYSFG